MSGLVRRRKSPVLFNIILDWIEELYAVLNARLPNGGHLPMSNHRWEWQPPAEPEPCRTIFSRPSVLTIHKAGKKHHPPPGEAEWQATLGKQLDRLLRDSL